MERINWKITGMSCSNCALTIHKFLEEKGMQDVKVNFIGGNVSFEKAESIQNAEIEEGIAKLGYHVANDKKTYSDTSKKKFLNSSLQRFIFCAIFTLPLLLNMLGLHATILMNAYVQLALTIPVFIVGMFFFGRSAWHSLTKGIPNMNVLITLGAIASFGYSLYGTLTHQAMQFMFYETTATIITFIFFGNYIEERAIEQTQASIKKLTVSQKIMANMIAYDEHHNEHIFPVENNNLKVGDLILIKTGEYVPMDCKILWGDVSVNDAIITGESTPVEKKMNDKLIGGSIIENGTVKAYVTAVGEDTVINHILKMVQDAQTEKPPVQKLADKISAVFVPVVVGIALLTFFMNYAFAHVGFTQSLLRSIAVLVIACPCAMGLATPAAIAVGLGRAARNGILFKNAGSLEFFKNIRQVVFDKTGTLTTGEFIIRDFQFTVDNLSISIDHFRSIVFSLEKYSTHPIAKSIAKSWKTKNEIRWAKIEEIKGLGMKATDKEGNEYIAGSYKVAKHLTEDLSHNVYVIRNNELLGWIDVADEIRKEAKQVISVLHARGIKTILLSGDSKLKCDLVAKQLGIDEVVAEQTPQQKLAGSQRTI